MNAEELAAILWFNAALVDFPATHPLSECVEAFNKPGVGINTRKLWIAKAQAYLDETQGKASGANASDMTPEIAARWLEAFAACLSENQVIEKVPAFGPIEKQRLNQIAMLLRSVTDNGTVAKLYQAGDWIRSCLAAVLSKATFHNKDVISPATISESLKAVSSWDEAAKEVPNAKG